MKIFALEATRSFGRDVAEALRVELAPHEEREFEDQEHKARPLTSVRGENAYVIQSLHGGPDQSPNDKLCRLLFFIAALRENGARHVTAVIPYLAYARKDRQTKPRDPVTSRYVAQLLEAAGTQRVVTMEVHNIVAFQNGFRCETIHLDTRRLFARRALALAGSGPVVVASPDPGGVKRAQLFGEGLEARLGRSVGSAFMEKRRSGGHVSGTLLAGEVRDAVVIIVDDLIASGGTMVRAARACLDGGARSVNAMAAHGLFTGDAATALADQSLATITVSDTVPPFRLPPGVMGQRLEVVSAAPLFAEAIRRLDEGGSITELLDAGD